jgi:catechol 2,3-dioxygenase-like lactoylglutathione lyase family enzyme
MIPTFACSGRITMRVFRIALPAADIDASRGFYERVLALEADDTVPSRLYFHCGDVILALIDWGGGDHGPFHPIPDNVYFATGELDAVFSRAVAAGAQIESPIETQPWHERSFYYLDPDGNRLCFVDESTLFLGAGAEWS